MQTYLSDILHVVSQALLAPDIILLLLFIGYALFCIGSVVSEYFTERRHFKVTMPKFLAALMAADEKDIPAVIEQSDLLKRQKLALLTVYDYRTLPGDALVALIRRLVSEEETHYDRITGRNNTAARVSPMLGLMGTLIPLGPGIQALGKADTEALSASLLVAFDTTVAGLVVAAVCLVVGKIRSNWYGNYMSALDSAMATMLQKIEDMREAGQITVKEPSDYAFLYGKLDGRQSAKKGDQPAKPEAPSEPRVSASEAQVPKNENRPTRATQSISQAADAKGAAPAVSGSAPLPNTAQPAGETANVPASTATSPATALPETTGAQVASGMPFRADGTNAAPASSVPANDLGATGASSTPGASGVTTPAASTSDPGQLFGVPMNFEPLPQLPVDPLPVWPTAPETNAVAAPVSTAAAEPAASQSAAAATSAAPEAETAAPAVEAQPGADAKQHRAASSWYQPRRQGSQSGQAYVPPNSTSRE